MAISRVILDFDNTLFDADDFKVALSSSLKPLGVSDDLFWNTYRQAREQRGDFGYSFERHVDLMAARQTIDARAAVGALQSVLARAGEYLYPDAKEFLSRLISLGIPATLLTRGDPDFQRAKIAACGIDRLVDEVIVTKEPKIRRVGEILRADEQGTVYYIDDHLDATQEIYKAHPRITPVLKRRADQPPERYLGMRLLNFRHLSEIRDYLTIVHATNPTYGE